MTRQSRNIAIILAGGSGTRFGDKLPKQFREVAGKKIIAHTISVFENNERIDEIAVVCQPQYAPLVGQIIADNRFIKVKKILNGGSERHLSSLNAITAYDNDGDNLLFHDAVRPLVSDRIINDCIAALACHDAVAVAVRTTDTILEVDENERVARIPDRSALRNAQTPQGFKRGVIKRAYDQALRDPDFRTTDDCGVVCRYLPEIPIHVVEGESFNIKVTHAEDIYLLDRLYTIHQRTQNT